MRWLGFVSFAWALAGVAYAAPGDLVSISAPTRLSSIEISDSLLQYCPGAKSKIIQNSILLYAVQYETTHIDGTATRASGALAVPETGPGPFSLVSYQHGTTINRLDVPSRNSREGRAMSSCYGSQGFVVALPDYLGYGDSIVSHPYMHAATEATATADFLRAVRKATVKLGLQLNSKLFLAGYSVGGHATMALHHYLESTLGSEFQVTASAPMAGPYDMVNNFKIQIKRPSPFSSIQLGFLLWSWNQIYGWYSSLDELIAKPYVLKFDLYFGGNGDWPNVFDLYGVQPKNLIRAEPLDSILNDPNSPIVRSLEANSLFNWRPLASVNLYHGDRDINVPIESSILAHRTMSALGGNVTLTWISGKDHQAAAPFAYAKSIEWFNSF